VMDAEFPESHSPEPIGSVWLYALRPIKGENL
jgi:hypothetical protein